jgi:hypothetical protein
MGHNRFTIGTNALVWGAPTVLATLPNTLATASSGATPGALATTAARAASGTSAATSTRATSGTPSGPLAPSAANLPGPTGRAIRLRRPFRFIVIVLWHR